MGLLFGDHFDAPSAAHDSETCGKSPARLAERLGRSLLEAPRQGRTLGTVEWESIPFVGIENRPSMPQSESLGSHEVHTQRCLSRTDQGGAPGPGMCSTTFCILEREIRHGHRCAPCPPCRITIGLAPIPTNQSPCERRAIHREPDAFGDTPSPNHSAISRMAKSRTTSAVIA